MSALKNFVEVDVAILAVAASNGSAVEPIGDRFPAACLSNQVGAVYDLFRFSG